jgi:hypothetical protein
MPNLVTRFNMFIIYQPMNYFCEQKWLWYALLLPQKCALIQIQFVLSLQHFFLVLNKRLHRNFINSYPEFFLYQILCACLYDFLLNSLMLKLSGSLNKYSKLFGILSLANNGVLLLTNSTPGTNKSFGHMEHHLQKYVWYVFSYDQSIRIRSIFESCVLATPYLAAC